MSALGHFQVSNFGKITQLTTGSTTHAALTGSSAHGAVSAATVNQIITRDSNGRADIIAPPASDDTTKLVTSAWVLNEIGLSGGGTVTSVSGGVGLTGTVTTSGNIDLANTDVTPATYTFATVTVDAQGRITSASSGSAVTAATASSPLASTGGSTPNISIQAATSGQHGYMSSTYAGKLDGIASGAQVNQATTVFGRSGAVVAVADDYDIQEIKGVTVSDSSPSGGSPVNGDLWFEY